MSGHEFKPGGIAMVEMPSGGERLGILLGGSAPCWHTAKSNGDMDCRSAEAVVARPVVVIDPEDREQVKRLTKALAWALHPDDADRLADALRSLIAPPPKCGAIVTIKGEWFDCDRGKGHGLPHDNREHGAIWQGVDS